ncbi:hypothetical protein M409DRAFT_23104 [Zasmidium cellare ATCC 36951]|uniref:F-box domain-containing protein n=1 Tax=Zasmidium cellare ATCC 36951 TaxID=1080233 RepID=A0A6A6CH35_ZASCE|nr:uncharacterized protein M409DRAFT_23104 [Zasmidium cellare ATCC 36951]KAF2166465.1 hypothetical protein M409DRAFT_23104 [Zasmidium cellare ATCC 36951]
MADMAESTQDQSSAAHRTFQVPELLEMIFLKASITDLLTKMPRVCKHWKATIEGSIKLQRALFFKPSADVLLHQDEESLENMSLGEVYIQGTEDTWNYPVIANPFLFQLTNDYLISWSDASHMPKGVERPEASWRRMLVTQPPMAQLDVHSQWCGCQNFALDLECWTKTSIQGKEAAKLGQVVREGATPMSTSRWEKMHAESAGRMVTILEVALEYDLIWTLEHGGAIAQSDYLLDRWA